MWVDHYAQTASFSLRRPPTPGEPLHDHLIRAARGPLLVIMDAGKHTFPSRTRPLSPQSPMVVQPRCCARVGRRQVIDPGLREEAGVSYFRRSPTGASALAALRAAG